MAWLTSLTIIWVWMRDWRAMVFLMLCFSSNSKEDPLENGKVSRLWLTSDEALWSSFSMRPSSAMPDFKDPWSSKWSLGSVRFRVSNHFLKLERQRFFYEILVQDRAHFLSRLILIKFQTVGFKHHWNMYQALILPKYFEFGVFQVISSSSLAEFKFWRLKLIESSSFEQLDLPLWITYFRNT